MSKTSKPIRWGILSALLCAELAVPSWARAQDGGKGSSESAGPPTRAEFNKLQNDVREQRQLIIQMMQTEQQRYDMLLRLLQGQGGGTPLPGLSAAPAAPGEAPASDAPAAKPTARASAKAGAGPVEHRPGSIEGTVTVPGGSAEDVYVYVENVKTPLPHHKVFEIKQEGRQFNPRVAVVQTGTNLVFPNFDSVYHTVYSNSP